MVGAVQGPLNPEPALPNERAPLHLPPKSYAAATEEGLDSSDDDLTDATNGNAANPPGKRGSRRHRSSKDTSSLKSTELERDGQIQFEKKERKVDGHTLTTGKPDDSYEDMSRQDKAPEAKPVTWRGDTKMVSGRRAGAGWDRR